MNARMVSAGIAGLTLGLALTADTRADEVVYVSQSVASPSYADLKTGSLGQTGALGNPFGSIQAAYHYLYTRGGNHEIRLIHNGDDGTYGGAWIGANEFDNGNGYLRMVSNNAFPNGGPSWTSAKLVSADPLNRVTLRMSYPSGPPPAADGITSPAEGTNAYPAAYEKEVPNPSGGAAVNRGQVIRGLWNPGTSMALTGMIVEDLDIVLGGGHVLVGTTASTGGIQQQFEFNNVNLFMEREMYPFPEPDGPIWGKSALFASHMNQTDLNLSSLSFNNSNIYLVNNDGSAWEGDFYVGQTWGSGSWFKLPNDFVSGNNTSTFNYWNGTEYVEWVDAPPLGGGIWQSGRNAGNTLTAYQNNVGTNNNFFDLESFAVPEPSSLALAGLAGAAAGMYRLFRRSGRLRRERR